MHNVIYAKKNIYKFLIYVLKKHLAIPQPATRSIQNIETDNQQNKS